MSERTTLYLRGIPRQLAREAKARAARQGSTLAALVCESLTRSLDQDAQAPVGGGLAESRDWYERNRARLLARYRGEYLAIVAQTVVDHDRDFEALAVRVFETHREEPVFMPKVTEHDEPARLRSPRRVRR